MYGDNSRRLAIGIDFDDTITRNEDMFFDIIKIMKNRNCDVYIVTARGKNQWCEKLRNFSSKANVQVIFAGTKAKHEVAVIDIWIDDFPLAITHDFKEARWSPSKTLIEERLV